MRPRAAAAASYLMSAPRRQELRWAIEAGKPIVPVVVAADKPLVYKYIAEGKLNWLTIKTENHR